MPKSEAEVSLTDINTDGLEEIESHFKWKPDQRGEMPDISMLVETLRNETKGFPQFEFSAYSLLSYLLTVESRVKDYTKALEYAEDALKCAQNGEKLVALANKFHVLKKLPSATAKLSDWTELQQLSKEKDVKLRLAQAYAFTHFGPNCWEEALNIYSDIIGSENSPEAHLGKAFLLGRLRRDGEAYPSEPSPEEIRSLEKAVKGWGTEKALPEVWQAFTLYEQWFYEYCVNNEAAPTKNIHNLLKAAFNHKPHAGSYLIYKQCARTWAKLQKPLVPEHQRKQFSELEGKCCEKIFEMRDNCPDSGALHSAALYFKKKARTDKENKDELMKKAKMCMEKAWGKGNCWADQFYIHLIREAFPEEKVHMFKKLDSLFKKQSNLKRVSPAMHMIIGTELYKAAKEAKVWHMLIIEDADDFIKRHMFDALQMDKRLVEARNTLSSVLEKQIEEEVASTKKVCEMFHDEQVSATSERRRVLLTQRIDLLFLIGNYKAAKECYEKETFRPVNNQTSQQLCEIYYNLGDNEGFKRLAAQLNVESPIAPQVKMELESRETVQKILNQINNGLEVEACNDVSYSQTQAFYDECAQISPAFLGTTYVEYSFGLNNWVPQLTEMRETLKKNVVAFVVDMNMSNIHPKFHERLREIRFRRLVMTQRPKNYPLADLLCLARYQIDGCFYEFAKDNPKLKRRGRKTLYYPFTARPKKDEDRSYKMARSSVILKITEEMQFCNFTTQFNGLFKFICEHQAAYSSKYDFLPEVAQLVNRIKHENGSYSDNSDNMYNLVHSMCEYVEIVVAEFSKYMRITSP